MEQSRSRPTLGIVLIGSGVLGLLVGTAGDSIPIVVAGCLALVLGVAFVGVSRQGPGGTTPTEVDPAGRERFEPPIFTASLRGYDMVRVDGLIRRCDEALASGEVPRIEQAKAELDRERVALPIALRGYALTQVDEYLERLSALLGHRLHEGDVTEAG
ncbi:hypothetical protein [Micromonospora sp. NPDC126480]|uniref:hypothetical protein n=1 Tax=Micromonospora sp. NPDC126480 TaxID=3155312 RepID=UPI00332EAB64